MGRTQFFYFHKQILWNAAVSGVGASSHKIGASLREILDPPQELIVSFRVWLLL